MTIIMNLISLAITIVVIESRSVVPGVNDASLNDNSNDINQKLRDAARNGNETLVMELLPKSTNINEKDEDSVGETALTWAARNGHENIVRILLENSAIDVNGENYLGVIL